MARLDLLGIGVDALGRGEALARLEGLARGPGPSRVFFLNAHCANLACRDAAYARALAMADLVLPDGSGLALAGRLLGHRVPANLNGTDLFPLLCAQWGRLGLSLYLLGGRPGVAQAAAGWVSRRYPGLRLAGGRDGYFSQREDAAVVEAIRASRAQVLVVALGAPHQELWLEENLAASGARLGLGVGGLLDFYSGRLPRAPIWLRRWGLEWAWRLALEPRRLGRRYLLGGPLFLHRVWRQRRGRAPWGGGGGR